MRPGNNGGAVATAASAASTRVELVCPKCGHVRSSGSAVPAWQCPACGIAYAKYRTYLARMKTAVAAPTAEQGAPALVADGSVWSLVLVNAFALVLALAFGWRLVDLMAVYWLQSVAIGASYFFRILGLERFSTEGFRINNRAVEPTPATKRQTALFFLVHFGGFHLGYLVFIVDQSAGSLLDASLLICAVAFAANHAYSYRYHRELDRRGTPNIGTLMFTPYLRIVPMHLTIVLGATAFAAGGVLLFGVLKLAADVLMHVVEHRLLARQTASSRT